MTLSIITVSHRSERHLPRYVESFLASGSGRHGAAIEFVIVENSAYPDTEALVEPLRRAGFPVTFFKTENRGFGAGCNAGAARATGETLIFANPDLSFVDPLDPIDIGRGTAWGTAYQEDGPGQSYAFDVLPEHKTALGELRRQYRGYLPNDPVWRDRLYPVGSFFVVGRALFERSGRFDERFFMYHEEAELARRLHRLVGPPTLFGAVHVRHEAFGSESSRKATLRAETRGLLTYAQITGERRILRTRALTQALLAPVSAAARLRLRLLVAEMVAERRGQTRELGG